ncbi:MAG: tRNA-specific adenosine deaminase [Coxiella sp. (in: Bacteria)]|nr:MAG: tRNA-specific adenosine deaminase [Coxiella sp. (in: g-proteobacteria)]
MHLANRAALYSVQHGGGPFGAVILQIDNKSGRVIRYWVGHNQVVENHDPTAHAEVDTIRMAAKDLGVVNLGHINRKDSKLAQPSQWSHCIIYSSAESCPMCYSAIYWAGMKTLIFAATRYDAAAKGVDFSDADIYESLTKPYAKRKHHYRHSITNDSLGAFNYYKRTPVKRYGQK